MMENTDDGKYSLYSIKTIMPMECPTKHGNPTCVCVCVCVCVHCLKQSLFKMFICLSCHIMLCTLISFKRYCLAQWSTIVVVLYI